MNGEIKNKKKLAVLWMRLCKENCACVCVFGIEYYDRENFDNYPNASYN